MITEKEKLKLERSGEKVKGNPYKKSLLCCFVAMKS